MDGPAQTTILALRLTLLESQFFFKIKGLQARLYLKTKEYWDCQFYKVGSRAQPAKMN
jgi:hypothetical protein